MNDHPLEALSQLFISEQNFADATVKSYGFAYMHYIKYLKEYQIEFAKPSDVIKYRESKRSLGYSTQWIYIQICALKGLYRYLRMNQKRLTLPVEYAYDIMASIKNENIKPRITKPILTLEQAKHLLLYTKNHRTSFWHYRDHAIIYLMLTSGMRSYEILRAKRCDYRFVEDRWLLHVPSIGCSPTDGFIKLSKGAVKAVEDYLHQRDDENPYLFITHKHGLTTNALSKTFLKDMFARVLKACGLEDIGITPHCLRHSAATLNLQRGGSIEATRQLLRHADIASTLIYANHIERLKDDSELQIDHFILGEVFFVHQGYKGYIILE